MTHGLQQQDTLVGFTIPKSAPSAQHGRKPAPAPLPLKPSRHVPVRPAH